MQNLVILVNQQNKHKIKKEKKENNHKKQRYKYNTGCKI